MKRIFLTYILLIAAVAAAVAQGYTPAQVPNVQVADRNSYVSNPDGLLPAGAVDSLNRILGAVWEQTTAEPVVVALSSLAPGYDENTFANDLFDLWKIGKADKDNGLLLLIVGDTRRYTVRTGSGLGGVLPDALCSSIMRNVAVPLYRKGDLGAGTVAAVNTFARVLTDPVTADEIRSKYSRTRSSGGEESDFFSFVLWLGVVAGVAMLVWVAATIISSRSQDDRERYRRLSNIRPVALFLSFLGLGIPLPAYLLCVWSMKRIRDHKRDCPNCGHAMRKLDEATDNNYLTPAQDTEERLNSIDYDVWLCDNCGEKDVIPYINRQSAYKVCPACGARTCAPAGNRIIVPATTSHEGRGEHLFDCRNCGHRSSVPYTIARLAAPVVIFPGGGGGSGFGGGGGSFGGGFGGGGTSGGGASGGW